MTNIKRELLKKLRKKGVTVQPRLFYIKDLRAMLDVIENRKKVVDEFQAKKPEIFARRHFQPVLQQIKLRNKDLVKAGNFLFTFNLKMYVKERGYTTRLVSEDYTSHGDETLPEIVTKLSERFIAENDQFLRTYSQSEVEIVGTEKEKYIEKKNIEIREVRARAGHPIQYKMFPDDLAINKNEGQCALDMIMAAAVKSWPLYTRQRLIDELTSVAEEQDLLFLEKGVSTRHIMAWATVKKTVSCFALDPFMRVFESVIASRYTELTLTFIVNNEHDYPITDPATRLHIAKAGKINLNTMKFSLGGEDWCYVSLDQALTELDVKEKIIHVETDDLSLVMQSVFRRTAYNPVGIMSCGPFVTAFEHPITHQIYVASPDFWERKEVCRASLEETKYIGFIWNDQSWAQLWKAWVEFKIGQLPVSTYSEDALMIRETYPQSGYVGMIREVAPDELSKIVSYDIRQCYTSCMLQNEHPFAIESVFDDIEKFDWTEKLPVGKAYIARDFCLGAMKMSKSFYPSFFVQYCVNQNAIEKSDVTYVQRASRIIAADTFKDLTALLQEKFPSMAKRIVNSGIGAWGKRFAKSGSIAITDSFEIALGMAAEDKEVRLSELGNALWFMRKETKELLHSGHVGLREHIVCMGHIKLHQMEKAVTALGGEVIAHNTDSVKVLNSHFDAVPKETAVPGDICLEGKCNLRRSQMKSRPEYSGCSREWTQITKVEASIQRPSMMAVGQPGFGKSWLLKQIHDSDVACELKSEKLAWTKTAALNIHGATLDHVFPETSKREEWIQKAMKYDALNFDEFTIMPEKWYSLLLEIKMRKPSLKMRFFGDPDQLHSHDYDRNRKLWHRYDLSHVMYRLVDGNRLQLDYMSLTARYDADMKGRLDYFQNTSTLAAFGDRVLFGPDECDFNIVKNPQKRKTVNEKWAAHYMKGKVIVPCGELSLWEGMYLISHENKKTIVNSTRYLVKKICEKSDQITLEHDGKEICVTFNAVAESCWYGYADTVMRVISRTIPGKFNIHETAQMDWNEMFVALSRAQTAASIGMLYVDRKYEKAKPPAKGELIQIERSLFNGNVYEKTDGIKKYIGSTGQEQKKRDKQHKDNPVSAKMAAWLAEMGDKIVTNVLETYVCMTRQQLLKRESDVTAKVPAEICMNTKGVVKAAVEKAATKIEACEITYSRFQITDDVKERRLRIRWRDLNGDACLKNFSYKLIDKKEQQKAAEDYRAELIKQYFL